MKNEDIKLPEFPDHVARAAIDGNDRFTCRLYSHKQMADFAREAVRINASGNGINTQHQAEAWVAVAMALNEVMPDWASLPDTCGTECAVAAIRKMAEQAKAGCAAVKTLETLGYTYHGGEQWKPPLGTPPAFVSEPQPRPFDLEAAKRGEPIITRDGRNVTFVAHDPGAGESHRVLARIEGDECVSSFQESGGVWGESESMNDLFMAPKPKRTVWVNLYPWGKSNAHWHSDENSARSNASSEAIAVAVAVPVEIDS